MRVTLIADVPPIPRIINVAVAPALVPALVPSFCTLYFVSAPFETVPPFGA